MNHQLHHHRAHPWHGLSIGDQAPHIVNCYVEMVPTDAVKYELDKATGLLKIERPQQYSSLCPTLYGFLPKTYSGKKTADYCMKKTGLKNILGDGDPIDIAILSEKTIPRGDIILRAIPIGGFRMIDRNEADDKILGVLVDDLVYGKVKDISECPEQLIERLSHYFLTYKDYPGRTDNKVRITDIFGWEEAQKLIEIGLQDYQDAFLA
ncbi:MAG: inorganic pyrophosphatase [Chlamydiales bacterium]